MAVTVNGVPITGSPFTISLDTGSRSIEIDSGVNHLLVVTAQNLRGAVVFRAETTVNLPSGAAQDVTITLEAVEVTTPVAAQLVDAATGAVVQVTDPASPANGLLIDIPAGALLANTTVTVAEVYNPQTAPVLLSQAGIMVDLGPSGLVFALPVRVEVPYDAALVQDLGINEADLALFRLVPSPVNQWVQLPNQTVDTVNKKIIVELTSFEGVILTPAGPPPPPTENVPPVANAQTVSTPEDTLANIVLTGSDANGDALTFSVVTDPTNGTLSGPPPNVTYIPDANFNGSDSFTFVTNDGTQDSVAATVTIFVQPVNDPPVAVADPVTTNEDVAVTIAVLANDFDVDGTLDAATVTLTSGPSNGTVTVNPNGTITYMPALNFFGTDTFNYTVKDNLGATSNVASVTVTVNPTIDPPVATDDPNVLTTKNTPVTIPVLANDFDPDGTLNPSTVTIKSGPSNGTASPNGDGTVTYTPTTGFIGTDTFIYTVRDNDNAESNAATVTVRVNNPPVAMDDPGIQTNRNTPVTIPVLNNDSDSDGTLNPASVIVTLPPSNGTAVANPDGTVTYTPNTGFVGQNTFKYTMRDNDGATSNEATVTVDVLNVRPVATDDPNVLTTKNTPVTIPVLANDFDPDGTLDPTTVTVTVPPSNGTASPNSDGTIAYTPNTGFCGSTPDTFKYTVKDNDGATSNDATVTVRVNCPPVASDDPGIQTNRNTPVTIPVLNNDADFDGTLNPASVIITMLPSNGTAVANSDGTVTYTPNTGFVGQNTFKYTVQDNDGATSNEATVTVNVVNVRPVANNDQALTTRDTPVTIPVLANDNDPDGTLVPPVTIETAPSNGTVTPNTDGTVTYTPNTSFCDGNTPDTFTYKVTDNDGAQSDPATVTVEVNCPPVVNDDQVEAMKATPIIIPVLANDTDSDGTFDPSTVTITVTPSSGTALPNADGTVTYTPNAGFSGIDTFKYTVQDNDGAVSNEATVTVTVPDIDLDDQVANAVGQMVTFTVSIKGALNVVDAMGFNVSFDPSVLQFVSFTRGTLVQNWDQFDVNQSSAGTLIVGGFTTVDIIQPGVDGDVVLLTFTVLSANSTTLSICCLVDDIATWTPGSGKFTFTPLLLSDIIPVDSTPVAVAIGDLNGDGVLDLTVAHEANNTISVLLGDAQGSFTSAGTLPVTSTPAAIAVGDLNGDGRADLVVSHAHDDLVSVLLSDAHGTFTPALSIPVDPSPGALAIGDLNGDGRADLAISHPLAELVSILLGDGQGTFTPASPIAVVPNPAALAIGDLNGDGVPDLAVTHETNHTITVLLGDTAGDFTPGSTISLGMPATALAIGDLNSDGFPDLAVAHEATSTISVLLGDASGGLTLDSTIPLGMPPTALAIGDLNGDGFPDLAVAHPQADTVSILLNQ